MSAIFGRPLAKIAEHFGGADPSTSLAAAAMGSEIPENIEGFEKAFSDQYKPTQHRVK